MAREITGVGVTPSSRWMIVSAPFAASTSSAVRSAGPDTACVSLPMYSGPSMPRPRRYSQIAWVVARMCASVKEPRSGEPRCPLVRVGPVERPHDLAGHGLVPVGDVRRVVGAALEILEDRPLHRGDIVLAVELALVGPALRGGGGRVDGRVELQPPAVEIGLAEGVTGQRAVAPQPPHLLGHERLVRTVELLEPDARGDAGSAAQGDKGAGLAHAEGVAGLEYVARAALALGQVAERGEDVVGHVAHEVVDALELLALARAALGQPPRLSDHGRVIRVDEPGGLEIAPPLVGLHAVVLSR